MTETPRPRYQAIRRGRVWDVVDTQNRWETNRAVALNFLSRAGAEQCCDRWNNGQAERDDV